MRQTFERVYKTSSSTQCSMYVSPQTILRQELYLIIRDITHTLTQYPQCLPFYNSHNKTITIIANHSNAALLDNISL